MNYKYQQSIVRSESFEQFAVDFSRNVINPVKAKGPWRYLPGAYRSELVDLLSQDDFIIKHFGIKCYSPTVHQAVLGDWESLQIQQAKERELLDDETY